MADTAEATGISISEAASLLTAPSDTQEDREPQAVAEGQQAATAPEDDGVAVDEAPEEPTEDDVPEDTAEEESAPAKVKLPDGTETTLDDLIKGHLRQSDYTKKTTEIAQQRKALEQEAAALRANRAQELQILQAAQQMLQQQLPPAPDLSLAQTDPGEYVRQKAVYDAAVQRAQAMSAYQQHVAQQTQAEQVQNLAKKLEVEAQSLKEIIPEWKDEKTASAERKAIIEYAKSKGAPEEMLSQVYNAWEVAILRDAMKYREMMAKKPAIDAKTANTPKLVTPGASQNSGSMKASELTRAKQRLAKTGDIKDAAAILLMG